MGNGAKAQMKRDRAANEKKGPSSQLKSNAQAMNIKCKVCMSLFMSTTRLPALEEHAQNKHGKGAKECFPDFAGAK
ncbi:hypothetical protein JCM10213_003342 [Rhodosporidiobolus nylandii]